ncbi:hypothetical protein ABH926_002771 [Catenulispora sp. GP43]|uniref:hypothetical protein n=1 Tax=Catenulispora sp. GP43 TaxID=3156263 RepID=UPI0035111811
MGHNVEIDVDEVTDWTVVEGGAPDVLEGGSGGLRVVGTVVAVGVGDDPVVTVSVFGGLIMVEPGEQARRGVSVGAAVSFAADEFRLHPVRL